MVPDWIDPDSWQAFKDMRKLIKAPLTDYAAKLILRELVKLKGAGEDPQACLDQSTRNGWRDVFRHRDKDLGKRHVSADETSAYLAEQAAFKSTPPSADILRMVGGAVRKA